MSRVGAGLAALAAGIIAWWGTRQPREAELAYVAVTDDFGQPTGEVQAVPVAPTAPVITAGRISPQDVLALLPQADPDGWMPPADLLAFVEVESGFRPRAYRFEAHLNEASYGLMQTLASTARDRGYQGDPEGLFDPLTSLTFGIAAARWKWDFLARRLGRDPTETEWVGAYNAGVGNVLRGFIPQGYVRKWTLARDRWAGAV